MMDNRMEAQVHLPPLQNSKTKRELPIVLNRLPSSYRRSSIGFKPPQSPSFIVLSKSKMQSKKPVLLGAIASNRRASIPTITQKRTEIVTIRIYSNWGDPSLLVCSEVSFFDTCMQTINVQSVSCPILGNDPNFEKLHNKVMFPTTLEETWNTPWPRSDPFPFEISFSLNSTMPVSSVIIWPYMEKPEACMQLVEIFIDGYSAFKGTVDKSFGETIQLQKAAKMEFATETQINQISPLTDKYGTLILDKVSTITLSILSTYSPTKFFGLRAIHVFDYSGNPIDIKRYANITISGASGATSKWNIVGQLKMDQCPFHAILAEERCDITLTFNVPMQVSALHIVNYHYKEEGPGNGIKNFVVYVNNRNWFSGRLPRRYPILEKFSSGEMVVYFTYCTPLFKSTIAKHIEEWNQVLFDEAQAAEELKEKLM